ncbi:hypothetical protein A2U01_0042670, partial [Trifolium medium]|nr:hypothetical protein [Trifolium medium]
KNWSRYGMPSEEDSDMFLFGSSNTMLNFSNGKKICACLGNISVAYTYDYPDKRQIRKAKIEYDLHKPIRADLPIGTGSTKEGMFWVDFRI